MADYKIKWVPAQDMGERDFILCNKERDGVVLYLNKRVRTLPDEENAAVLETAWRAFRRLAHVGDIPVQRQREHARG